MPVFDPVAVLKLLSSEEKIKLLSGDDMWHTAPIPRLGIPRARVSDGPNGVRGTAWTNAVPSACFPCATALGASFDVALIALVGRALGAECRARGVHCLLGPTTNIQRHGYGGRGFESFSEDPMLSGTIAIAWINGVQSQKVMTTPKHFVANEQEHLRRSNNSVIDLRTLHEIYLEPFRLQRKANPSVFMSSYNRVNGLHVAEQPWLLREILRKEFDFSGLLMSDWSGTYSSSEAIKAGLDLEMPGPTMVRGVCVERDLVGGKLTAPDVDDCILRILNFVKEAQDSGIPFEAVEKTINTPEVSDLLLEAARAGIVLLKNSAKALPMDLARLSATTGKPKIAVIGFNAKYPTYAGGGSANLTPTFLTTPLDCISAVVHEHGGTVEWAMGADPSRWTPLLTPFLRFPGAKSEVGQGLLVSCDFYDKDPWQSPSHKRKPLFNKCNNSSFTYLIDGIPASVPVRGYVSLKTEFVPNESGMWELGLGVAGQADLYLDGKMIIENSTDQKRDLLFFNTGAEERCATLKLEGGQVYQLEVRFSNFKQINAMSPYTGRRGGIRIGGRKLKDPQELINEALELSRNSDSTIVIVGTTSEWESEGYERSTLSLPGHTEALISALLDQDPNTIIVNQSGMPVHLPCVDNASTIVQAFFGGNQNGQAIADCIFGKFNPGGKLPITWPKKAEDYPSHSSFGADIDSVYEEGLNVGYRGFNTPGKPTSEFCFGHGLSYTTFRLSLQVVASGFGAKVTLDIANTGPVSGTELAQIYVHPLAPLVERPEMELAGFAKVFLQPGEEQTVTIDIDHKAFSYYDAVLKAWRSDRGGYEIRLGTSVRDIVAVESFQVERSFTWTGIRQPELLKD